jgi:hypothetical protein
MDAQLYSALIVFGIAILGGLGTLVAALVAWLAKKLDTNTHITTQARDASNGRLSDTLDLLATERDRVMGLRFIIRERDDRISYLVSRLPEADQLLAEYRDRRTRRATEADEIAAERHALGDAP